MQYPQTTKIKQISLPESELIKDLGQTITYYKNHLIVQSKAVYKVEDPVMGRVEREFENRMYIHQWANLEMGLELEDGVYLYCVHLGEWRFYFEKKEGALTLFNELVIWKSQDE